ncbi:hypothetical protein ACTPEM_22785, partial [Clostridioides difficile]
LKDSTGQKKVRTIRRLEVVEAFKKSGNKPEWMILDAIPVIPPFMVVKDLYAITIIKNPISA